MKYITQNQSPKITQNQSPKKKQNRSPRVPTGLPPATYEMIRALAERNRRTIVAQITLMAEIEAQKCGIL